MKRIGLFLPNWVGDLAMATPALRAIRQNFPEAHVVGVLRPYLVDVLAGTDFIDEFALYDPRSRDLRHRSIALARGLRAARLDAIVLFTNSLRTAILARLAGAPRRIGFARNGRSWLLSDRLHQPRAEGKWVPAPVLDDYLRLVETLGCATDSTRIELATTPADEKAADAAFARLGIHGELVTLNCSGAFGAAKLWPLEYFAELGRRLAQKHDVSVLAVCGPSEREIARQIVAGANHPRVAGLADQKLSIGLTKACVRRSRLVVTTDSGPRHFAAAFDVPVVTLFGPTHIAWSENHFAQAVHLQKPVDCGPCQQRVCPLGHHRCMRELSVDEVYQAASRLLETTWNTQAA